jgi:hypothetical protein
LRGADLLLKLTRTLGEGSHLWEREERVRSAAVWRMVVAVMAVAVMGRWQ